MYSIDYIQNEKQQTQLVDKIILAAPLELANIEFGSQLNKLNYLKKRDFVPVYKTFVIGKANPAFFNLEEMPDHVLSSDLIIGKISHFELKCRNCQENDDLYLLQHKQILQDDELKSLFVSFRIIKEYALLGYPDLREHTFPEIILESGLFYINSMESLASATELEAISARNIVNLILQQQKKQKNTDL